FHKDSVARQTGAGPKTRPGELFRYSFIASLYVSMLFVSHLRYTVRNTVPGAIPASFLFPKYIYALSTCCFSRNSVGAGVGQEAGGGPQRRRKNAGCTDSDCAAETGSGTQNKPRLDRFRRFTAGA